MTGLGKAPITQGMAMAACLASDAEGSARRISAIRPLREEARAGVRPAPLASPAQCLEDEFRRRPTRELLLACDQVAVANGKGLDHRIDDELRARDLPRLLLDPEGLDLPGVRPTGVMPERETMPSTAGCATQPPAALLNAMLLLTGCMMGNSETRASCPPFVDYASAGQARSGDEVDVLPESAVIIRMSSDCAEPRDQARSCRPGPSVVEGKLKLAAQPRCSWIGGIAAVPEDRDGEAADLERRRGCHQTEAGGQAFCQPRRKRQQRTG